MRTSSFTGFRQALIDGLAGRRGVLRRLRIERLFQGRNKERCTTARTKKTSHVSAKCGLDLEVAIWRC